MISRADKDVELWEQWKRNPSEDNTRALLQQTAGVRNRAVQTWSGSISPGTLQSEAVKQSINAFQTYNPKKNVKLTTHLTNSLKKLSRDAYAEVSFLRMPEDRQMRYQSFNTAREDLKDRLGRDPSPYELSDELGWTVAECRRFLNEDRTVLISSEPLPVGLQSMSASQGTNPNDPMHFVIADLPEQDRIIFEHTTGYGGAKILSGQELMGKLGITQSQLSYRKRIIAQRVKQYRG